MRVIDHIPELLNSFRPNADSISRLAAGNYQLESSLELWTHLQGNLNLQLEN